MNKQFFRVIWSAARAMRVVVHEAAATTGKGSSKATTVVAAGAFAPMLMGAAFAGLLTAPFAHAQIVGAPNVAGTLRPTVMVAPNGVPVVNIQTPSAAGVSRNVYQQFNVAPNGAILNNSRTNVGTQIGGIVQGNPYLATGPARIILNEVNGGSPSQLRGYIEVAGQRAEVIIANPAGISINGGGFINASRATLTTGTPQFNAIGGLDSFLVRGGTVTIDGAGLDASKTDYAAILARAVQLNAAIYATDLKVVTGANQVSADHTQITPTAGTGAAPTFALDAAALGGMYAGKITLIGTEAGLGVRNAGSIGASNGNLVVTSAGRLENTGTLEGTRVELASAGDIDNRGGTIRQTSSVGLAITAPALSNTNGGVIGVEPAPAPATPGTSGGTSTGTGAASTGTTTTGATSGSSGTAAPAPAPYVPTSPGTLTAAGTILNDGGKIFAGGPVTLNTPQISNAGGSLSVASMAVTGPTFTNAGGTLNVSNSFSANVGQLDNTGGTLNAGSLNIATTGDLINVDGKLTSATDATLTVGGHTDNTRGTISATGALTANVTGAIDNTAGTLASNQALTLAGQSLNNSQGNIASAGGNVQATIGQQLLNTDGRMASGANLTIQSGSLEGAKGSLQSTGDLNVTAAQGLTSTGTNAAGGKLALQGASVDLSGSQTGAAHIAVTATQGDVTTSGATVATPGTLAITANAQPGQTLVNSAGQLNAGQLQISVSNLANTNGGEIVQTGTGATTIATSGILNNDRARIASNGQDLSLSAASITNTGGKIEHAGTGTLTIAGGSYSGANGQITANGALSVAMSGAFSQDGGTTYARQIDLSAGSLSNQGGSLVQAGTGATTLAVGGLLNNNGGTVASNGAIVASAGSVSNQGGTLQAGGASSLSLTATGSLDNSAGGKILSAGNTTLAAGGLNNNAGSVTAVGDLNATISGAATNVGGTLAANGHTTLSAASLDNSGGAAAAVTGNLTVTTSGTTTNNGGTLQAGGATTLGNGGLSNQSGKVFGNSLDVDTHGNTLDNTHGTLAATTVVALNSGALVNDAGLIQSGGAMTIQTNGNAISNTNAAGYTNGQGGITSGDTLSLTTGAVANTAGFIGARNALTASTQAFSNTGGGVVLGQSAVAIDTNGASYDNSGGQTLAMEDLRIDAGSLTNTGGLIRSMATTTLNAGSIVNTSTSGSEQGIEGQNVAISTGPLDNTSGAIRADVSATITSGGIVNNTSGLISAGNALAIVDPNAANPGAKTLNLINTGGTLVADQSLQIDAATFSGDGKAVSGQDLGIALTQDIVNNGEVAANGNLSYTTTGNFTNNGKLLAGQTLTIGGNNVDNTANAEMSGTDTVVNAAGTLTNRGLIDSQGATQIDAGTLNNIGTGRIYGDAISIAAGTLNNDAETVNGLTKAGTIAARDTLDIGAGTINNREHALIFSGGLGAGSMNIGGALDANRKATGQGAVLNNLSADIESMGDMSLSMAQINNKDTHITLGPQATTLQVYDKIGIEGVGIFAPEDVIALQGQTYVWARNPDGSQGALLNPGGNIWGTWKHVTTITADTAVGADPARIVAGGDMNVNGRLYNENSKVLAGGTITANDYVAGAPLTGQVTTLDVANVYDRFGVFQETIPLALPPQQIALGGYEYTSNVNATNGYNAGAAPIGGANANAQATGGVNGAGGAGVIVQVPANVGGVAQTSGTAADAAGGGSAGAGQTVPMVVRTSAPNTRLPTASLFGIHAGPGGYLIETDPRFTNKRMWLSSDYLLNNLGQDPNNILKRLGDGFYEQKLIREQVAQLTGYRYLDGFDNDDDQYTALMNAGVTFAKQYGLRPGVGLSAAQMAQLTSDIVWLVEQTVTLPDGSTQRVLVPQVYVRVRPGDIDGSGSLLSADATVIKSTGDLVNTGTIAGRTLVSIDAENVNNLGGRIAGGSIGINARNDLNNIGASITARDAAVLTAGRDINIRTTTQSASGAGGLTSSTTIDRVAGVYVTNPGGTLIASAGRDVNLIGAALVSGGSAAVGAGRNINMGTVTESSAMSSAGKQTTVAASQSREVGSVVQAQDNVRLAAGNDINIRAGAVASLDGALVATAKNDINLTAGQATTSVTTTTQKSSDGLFRKKSSSTFDSTTTTEVLSSSLSGKAVAAVAGNDINLQAAQLHSDDAMSLSAGRDINLTTATSSRTELHASQQRTSSTALSRAWALASDAGGPVGGYGNRKNSGNSTSVDTQTQAVGTTISAGSLQTVSGRDTTLQAATVVADRDITMLAGRNLTIESAQNTQFSSSSSANAKSGFIGSWSQPGVGHIKDFGAQTTSRTTQQASQVASLAGNVTLVAGNEYRQTASSVMAAGQAGPLAGGDVNILAKNVTINEAFNTEQSMAVQRSSSSKLGGSASFMGISTDNLRNAQGTVREMGGTKGNDRMQAMGALNLAMSGKQAYDAGSTLAGALNGTGPSLTSMSELGTLSYGVSVSASRNTSQGTSFSTSSTAVGSSVTGANNVNIVATGGGAGSNIHAVGSTIAAGNTVNLAADNDVILEASKNTSMTVGQNSSHGTSVGVTFGAGAQNGFSIQVGVQSGKGRNNQNEITYNATQVSGGNAVNISSGRNLTLNGATIEANRVTADVGGDLNIASLQDVSVGQSRQSSGGFGVSLCIPPICYGVVATVSANSASAKANGVFISPAVQSGIKAGDGGFDVNVKGNTNLTGAVIESTQAAIDAGKNSFYTGGALTMSDLQNVSQSSGSSYAVGGSVGLGYTTRNDPTPSWSPKEGQSPVPLGGSPGVGSYSGNNQASVTKSGISGIAGDQSVRTGDNASAGSLVKDWNTQAILQNVQAQSQLTQQFNQNISREIGTYASKQAAELRDQASKESDPAKKQALLEDATKWDEGGEYRVAAHMGAGLLSGGVAGALGAGASATLMPRIGDAIDQMGLETPVAQALGAVTAAAIGGIAGGTAGAVSAVSVDVNNRQLHPTERQLIGKLAADKAKQLCAGSGECEKKATVYWTDILEKTAKGQVDNDENAKNSAYLATLLATTLDPNSEGARGGVERYVQDLREAQGILSPYVGKPIVVNGVTQHSYGSNGEVQTYFSATPEQQADPYINTFLGQAANPIVLDLAKRDATRLENFRAQNGSATPDHIVEELVLGGAIINRGIGTVARLAESLDVALAGKVVPSSGGNISAQKITMEGMPVKLTSSDLNMLSQIEKLPNTTLQGDVRELVADNYFIRNGYTPLNGKCGSNCFDGVYLKDGKVYINEVKPLNANGTISLNGSAGTGLPTQMTDQWVDDAIFRLRQTRDASSIKTADMIEVAKNNGKMVKIVSGVNQNSMTLIKVK
ncbi:hemagglutinin repeat-containing protein [Variovorax paradoxus]|uniref:two-partner secretion domain-containing protein n=1 Tax=Variovorax paradoxus TaxID=34073 RepID=UPI003D6629ED